MQEQRIQELETKIVFLERHLEEMDMAFAEVNDQLRHLQKAVTRLAAQQNKTQGPGGEESREDAVPPHY